MDLRDYEQSKFAIAEVLRSASACEQMAGLRERMQPLFARLAEDRFNLVVAGRFNRGKTSLMNAILATDRLPTGIVPLTSVITTVGYGSKERVVLKFQDSMLDREIPIEALAQHVTQQGNPGNIQRIARAEIQLPAEILRRGFHFVDTPGLGSVIVENTLTTEAFLPEADALVLVTSYESPLSEEEVRFFKAASISGRRIFVVLNKHDTVSPAQREAVLRFVRDQLQSLFGRTAPPIFSVSSTEGLQAKISRDEDRLEASGVTQLERELINFLLNEKSRQFLVAMCGRVREFLRELPRSIEVGRLIERIDALDRHFRRAGQSRPIEPMPAPADAHAHLHQLQPCEVCTQIIEELWDFVSKYQYELVAAKDERSRFADRGGLCPFHSWELQSVASPYGLCVGYPPLLERLAREIRDCASNATAQEMAERIGRLIPNQEDCVLCNVRDHAEREAIDTINERLEKHQDRALNSLSALCLRHFAQLTSKVRNGDLHRAILERQATILQRYAEDMARYAMKHDAVRRYLASQEETNAAARALLLVAGRRQVNFMPGRRHTRHDQGKAVREVAD